MTDIELVIRIPKKEFEELQSNYAWWGKYGEYIKNGIALPKGHGRLIDSELLDKRLNFVKNHTGGYKNTPIGTGIVIAMAENLDAPTVIETDKET